MANYKSATEMVTDERVGTVRGRRVTQYAFDVSIDGIAEYDALVDEYMIYVNGRLVKRMNQVQAKRMGLIVLCGYLPRI